MAKFEIDEATWAALNGLLDRALDLAPAERMFELPPPGWKILTPSFLARLLTNPNEPFRVRLRENAVDTGWNPRAPIHVFQSDTDEEAPFDDELVSVDRLRRNGATIDVHVFHGLDHTNSWIQTMPRAIRWFRSIE